MDRFRRFMHTVVLDKAELGETQPRCTMLYSLLTSLGGGGWISLSIMVPASMLERIPRGALEALEARAGSLEPLAGSSAARLCSGRGPRWACRHLRGWRGVRGVRGLAASLWGRAVTRLSMTAAHDRVTT